MKQCSGHREPTIAWWPGTIEAGTRSDALASTIDLLPTLARLAGVKTPKDRVIDGKDIAQLLTLVPRPGVSGPEGFRPTLSLPPRRK